MGHPPTPSSPSSLLSLCLPPINSTQRAPPARHNREESILPGATDRRDLLVLPRLASRRCPSPAISFSVRFLIPALLRAVGAPTSLFQDLLASLACFRWRTQKIHSKLHDNTHSEASVRVPRRFCLVSDSRSPLSCGTSNVSLSESARLPCKSCFRWRCPFEMVGGQNTLYPNTDPKSLQRKRVPFGDLMYLIVEIRYQNAMTYVMASTMVCN
ncbi:hypothetical protein CY35_16G047300 [Sphagnum magellanicum]|nr:hypothetical protein CY35_16G047300 [Sphagnum magellanicum]